MNTERMKKAAKNLDILVKVVGGIFGAGAWVLAIMGVLVLALGERMYDSAGSSLNLEFVTLYLAEGVVIVDRAMEIYAGAGLIVGGVISFLVSRGAKLVRKILEPMKEGRPFEQDAPVNLRKIAWLTLIGGVVSQALEILDYALLPSVFPIEEIFLSSAIERVEYSFTFSLDFLWVFSAVLFLSYVFDYGQKLQREADETL